MVTEVDEQFLRSFILEHAHGDILDCGCGNGALIRHLYHLRPGSLIGIDISPDKVNEALGLLTDEQVPDKRIDFEIMDTEQLGFKDESFDTVIMTDTLPYLSNPRVALSEVARVLRPNGKLLVAVSTLYGKGENNYGQFDVSMLPDLVGERFVVESIEGRREAVRLIGKKRPGEVRRMLELRPKRH